MLQHQYIFAQNVPLECPSCKTLFEPQTSSLKIGGTILCSNCRGLFLCRSKDLFDALKYIDRMVR